MCEFIYRLISCLIPNKSIRKSFRDKYIIPKFRMKDFEKIKHIIKTEREDYYEIVKRLYHEYKYIEAYNLSKIVSDRICPERVDFKITELKNKYPKHKLLYLTDNNYIPNDVTKINIDEIPNYTDNNSNTFIVGYSNDFEALKVVQKLSSLNLKYNSICGYSSYLTNYFQIDNIAYETLADEYNQKDKLGHFCTIDFETIFQAIKQTAKLQGDYVEIGTFQGASARAALNYMKRAGINRRAFFLDTYEGFTYESAQNSEDAAWVNTHQETSQKRVEEYLSDYENANVIKNNVCEDNLPGEINEIAVANIDVDMYDAVKAALEKVHPRLVKNGIMLAEDFGHTPLLIGAQKAVYEFLDKYSDEYICFYGKGSQMVMIKK